MGMPCDTYFDWQPSDYVSRGEYSTRAAPECKKHSVYEYNKNRPKIPKLWNQSWSYMSYNLMGGVKGVGLIKHLET